MKKAVRLVLSSVLVLALVLSFSACGSVELSIKKNDGEKNVSSEDDDVKEVTLAYFEAMKEGRLEEAKEFTQEDSAAYQSIDEMIAFMAIENVKQTSPDAAKEMEKIYEKYLAASKFEIEKIEMSGDSAEVIMMTNAVETNKEEMEAKYRELVNKKFENLSPEEQKEMRKLTEEEQLNIGIRLGLQAWGEIFDDIISEMETAEVQRMVELEKDSDGWKIVSVG